MKRWFIPSWNGDFRLEPSKNDPKKTILTVVDPTEEEKIAVAAIRGILIDRGWLKQAITETPTAETTINASLEEVGPVVVAALRPGPAVITAVRLSNGEIEVCEHREPGKATEKELKELAQKPASAAATVKRPTPSCPDCFTNGAIRPATESLLAFMTPDQHKTWARGRYLVTRGGVTGHRYILAHRDSEIAAKNTRICWDADDRDTLHFHDQSVPPEEEVLAAMLILQHREAWLRNEATCFYGLRFTKILKNPFGDHMDGVPDANLTRLIGATARALLES